MVSPRFALRAGPESRRRGSRVDAAGALRAARTQYPGDALWAVMVYLGWGVVLPKASPGRLALLASTVCVGVEFLKLWPAPWLVSLRHTTLGHLVFGHVFTWSNVPAYAAGILAAYAVERMRRNSSNA